MEMSYRTDITLVLNLHDITVARLHSDYERGHNTLWPLAIYAGTFEQYVAELLTDAVFAAENAYVVEQMK